MLYPVELRVRQDGKGTAGGAKVKSVERRESHAKPTSSGSRRTTSAKDAKAQRLKMEKRGLIIFRSGPANWRAGACRSSQKSAIPTLSFANSAPFLFKPVAFSIFATWRLGVRSFFGLGTLCRADTPTRLTPIRRIARHALFEDEDDDETEDD